jgi:hypothetical protein
MNLPLAQSDVLLMMYNECTDEQEHEWCQELIHDSKLQGEYFALQSVKKQLDRVAHSPTYYNLDMTRALEYSKSQITHSL